MNAILTKVLQYVVNRVVEPASILGYISLAVAWLGSHGIVLSALQSDSLTQWVIQTIALVLILLPDKILAFVPSKIVAFFKKPVK